MPFDALLKFPSDAACDGFLQALRAQDAVLAAHLRRARTLPVLRARRLTDAMYRNLEARLAGSGEIFRDVQFEPFAEEA